ncbi:hypothetical protein KJ966_05070 [bacterium]|nr:hypothetical protein [bacterium]
MAYRTSSGEYCTNRNCEPF